MHKLVDRLTHQLVIQLGIVVEGQSNIGVDQPQEGGRIGPLAAAHVAMIVSGLQEQVFDELLLPFIGFCHCLEGLAGGRGEPHAQLHAIEGRMVLGKIEISFCHPPQRGGHIPAVFNRLQGSEQLAEIFGQQDLEQAVFAAKIVVQGGFLQPGCIGYFLHPHGVKAACREQVEGTA